MCREKVMQFSNFTLLIKKDKIEKANDLPKVTQLKPELHVEPKPPFFLPCPVLFIPHHCAQNSMSISNDNQSKQDKTQK